MDVTSAKRGPTPPDLKANFTMEEFDEWRKALHIVDADVTQYTVGVVMKHLNNAGVKTRLNLEGTKDWDRFSVALRETLEPHFRQSVLPEWLIKLIQELGEICLLNETRHGEPASRISSLLACMFVYSRGSMVEKFISLLPEPHAQVAAARLYESWEIMDDSISQNASY